MVKKLCHNLTFYGVEIQCQFLWLLLYYCSLYRNQKVVLAIQVEVFMENVTSDVQMALGCLSH